jgi:S-DNA-T family DNA segregation ATPase FtsK/SpoIIIE
MRELLNYQANRIEGILAAQGLDVRVMGGVVGPRLVVFHATKPATVKLSAVMRMDEEIALGLGAPTCRIARNGYYLNIEIPRRDPATVRLLNLTPKVPQRFTATPVIGVDEEGSLLLLRLPSPDVGHVLICGTTGSGKTELARAMIAGLAMNNHLREVQLLLIDPKRRGYSPFAQLPHLLLPVIHDEDEALGALAWLVEEMERRDQEGCSAPCLIVFIDELADLMLASQAKLEHVLTRLTQRGREAGIHIVACTQKPTAAVIGSLIKSNFPVRIVGSVPDASDAAVATGISGTGAERLLGRGDFLVVAKGQVTRMQAAYISEAEIAEVITQLRARGWHTPEQGRPPLKDMIIDFVKNRRDGRGGVPSQRKGGHNRKPPTDEMIDFAYRQLQENGEVSQREVRRFHQRRYGSDCNPRRAKAAIETAESQVRRETERWNGKNENLFPA